MDKQTQDDVSAISEALGLFPSCIRSGEYWTGTCQRVLDKANAALAALAALAARPVVSADQYAKLLDDRADRFPEKTIFSGRIIADELRWLAGKIRDMGVISPVPVDVDAASADKTVCPICKGHSFAFECDCRMGNLPKLGAQPVADTGARYQIKAENMDWSDCTKIIHDSWPEHARRILPAVVSSADTGADDGPAFRFEFSNGEMRMHEHGRFVRYVDYERLLQAPPAASDAETNAVIAEILAERARQDAQWGPDHDDKRQRSEWIVLIDDQLCRARWGTVPDRLVKVAALAVAALLSIRRIEARRNAGDAGSQS